ncbi:MAG: alpha/beta hydrolase [Ktedonobacteraceae bacterium]|nr:alpha/beta hydrolase [Ktedonobacteraceae bacterium]
MPMNSPARDELLSSGDLTFHVVQWGTAGEPVIFIHGLTANAHCFQAFADALANDHRVFAYDLRGRGLSAKPASGYSIPIHATDLLNLLDTLGLERPVVAGHSLGAFIALYFATHHPDRLSKLILLDGGAPLPWSSPEEQPAWLTASISRLGLPVPSYEEYVGRLKLAPFLGPYWNDYLDLYVKHDVERFADGSVAARASRDAIIEEGQHLAEINPAQEWPRVSVPTLLLRAGQSLFTGNDQLLPTATADEMRRHIPGCQFADFPTLNHYTIVFGQQPGPAHELRRFLAED